MPSIHFLLFLIGIALSSGCQRPAAPAESQPDSATPAPPPLTRLRLQCDWYAQAEHGGHFQALAKGWYAEAGIDLVIQPGGPGARPYLRTAAGEADLVMGHGDDILLQAGEGGLPLVIVGAQMQRTGHAVVVHADSPVHSLRDLDGRKLMVNASAAWVPYVQASLGIRFDILPLNFGLGTFIADRELAQQCLVTSEPFHLRRLGIPFRLIQTEDGDYRPYRVIAANRDFLERHPEVVRAFLEVSARGWLDFLQRDPAPAFEAIERMNPNLPREQMEWSRSELSRLRFVEGVPERGEANARLDRDRLAHQVRILRDLNLLPADFTVDSAARFDLQPAGL